MTDGTDREMPRYKCHKEVHALKIKSVAQHGSYMSVWVITPVDDGYEPFNVVKEFIERHNPQPGDYYVVYDDDYKSISPAEAFEHGYRLI